jgi:hypothetical protein
MDKDELAAFLTLLNGWYHKQYLSELGNDIRDERCRKINSYGVLSPQAIAAIVGCTTHRVRNVLGKSQPTQRGTLNPQHLSMLAYALSAGKIKPEWVGKMVSEGTSVSTIAALTAIPESTLRRHRRITNGRA